MRYLLKTITLIVVITTFFPQQALAQINENFSDGNFSNNPSWSGTIDKFSIATGQLKLSAPAVPSSAYLSTTSTAINNAVWEFYVKLDFNPSTTNYARIYLVSDQADISASLNGYYVLIDDSGDVVSLNKQTGSDKKSLISGLPRSAAQVNAKIKVTRDASGNWELFTDYGLTGTYRSEGTAFDATHIASSYFGLYCVYTATRSTLFSFDDILVTGSPFVDNIRPEWQTISVLSQHEVNLVFSEPLLKSTAENVLNFTCVELMSHPANATLQPDQKTLKLSFAEPFSNGKELTMSVTGVQDLAGNEIMASSKTFLFFSPTETNFKDILITEIFPDPSPHIELPEAEFIELYNRSTNPIDLNGWKLTDGSSIALLSSRILLPGEYVIVSSTSTASQFIGYGKVLSASNFPTLNNTSDKLKLLDQNNHPIDSAYYNGSWYHDEDKKEGGWTLELINPNNLCAEDQNWTASIDVRGGTPGSKNSVFSDVPDMQGPSLTTITKINSTTLALEFSQRLNQSLPLKTDFSIEPDLGIIDISFSKDSKAKINLSLQQPIDDDITYTVTALRLFDCPGNAIMPGKNRSFVNLDTIPPRVDSLVVRSSSEIEVYFSEKLDLLTSSDQSNYWVLALENPVSVSINQNHHVVRLLFAKSFSNGIKQNLVLKNIKDFKGNSIIETTLQFLYFNPSQPHYKDVIITEIFADPSPAIGLPPVEFIEIYNRGSSPFDLRNWVLADATSKSLMPSEIILPHQYAILTGKSSTALLEPFGKTVGISNFPTLNNGADSLVLQDPTGSIIDRVNYSSEWYGDEDKDQGGWTLELIDTENLCAERDNWSASEDVHGGTPGKQNAIAESKPDLIGPQLVSCVPTSDTEIIVVFNEKLQRMALTMKSFVFYPAVTIAAINFANEQLTKLKITLSQPLEPTVKYKLDVMDIYDCPGNIIQDDFSKIIFGLPQQAEVMDVVVNEILFNPHPTGVDFIEVYNRSNKFINLQHWQLANREGESLTNIKLIGDEDVLFHPGSYLVFTENKKTLQAEHPMCPEDRIFEVEHMPRMNDDEGTVVIIDHTGTAIDQMTYTDEMHSFFLHDTEGVSLERIEPDEKSDLQQNWRSANASAYFATPGLVNSNTGAPSMIPDESVQVEPEIFQPVAGQPDFTEIKYQFDRGGFLANVRVFDPQGRTVKEIANNETLGTEGFFRWDGDQANGTKASIGYYMIWMEIYDETGMVKTFKKRVAIAGRF